MNYNFQLLFHLYYVCSILLCRKKSVKTFYAHFAVHTKKNAELIIINNLNCCSMYTGIYHNLMKQPYKKVVNKQLKKSYISLPDL